MATPKVSFTCMNTAVLGALPVEREDLELVGERVAEDHRRGREVAEHELVALLGDLRRGRDVDHERDAALLGDLGDGGGLAGVERADQQLRAFLDQALGAGARGVDVRLGVAVHDLQLRQAELAAARRPQTCTPLWQSWPMRPAARAGQHHADPQFLRLRADDRKGEGGGSAPGCGERLVEWLGP